jgi:hypothetical protein
MDNGSPAGPVEPIRVEVGDLRGVLERLGLPVPDPGATRTTVEVLPGRSVEFAQGAERPPPTIAICVGDVSEARRSISAVFGRVVSGPDTVHPDTLRLCGRLLGDAPPMIVAIHCPVAEESGEIPCRSACSPYLAFG